VRANSNVLNRDEGACMGLAAAAKWAHCRAPAEWANAEANGRFEASGGYADAASGAALARALGAAGTMPSEIACRFQ
jgi:hypothetical protein